MSMKQRERERKKEDCKKRQRQEEEEKAVGRKGRRSCRVRGCKNNRR